MTSHSKEIPAVYVDAYIEYNEQAKFINDKIDEIKDFIRRDIQNTIGSGKIVYNGKLEASLGEDASAETIDIRAIEEDDPELYKELLRRFGKTQTRKGSLRFKVL